VKTLVEQFITVVGVVVVLLPAQTLVLWVGVETARLTMQPLVMLTLVGAVVASRVALLALVVQVL
jgi:hypothetical protein